MKVKQWKDKTCLGIKLSEVDKFYEEKAGYALSQILKGKDIKPNDYVYIPFLSVLKETNEYILIKVSKSIFGGNLSGETEVLVAKKAIEA